MSATQQAGLGTGTPRPDALAVEVIDVHKSFGRTQVLRGVDLTVASGEVVCVIGPSGSGKSTLLRTVNHLVAPDRGVVRVGGELVGCERVGGGLRRSKERTVARHRARTGMVFQQFHLFSHLDAVGNVALGPTLVLGRPAEQARALAEELLERVGLGHRLHAYPASLSGGEAQRVGIARALAMEPQVMLFDEPTSALDPERIREVLDVVRDVSASGITTLVVTHELGFAQDAADTLVFFDEGRVVEAGPCQAVLERPEHERTREFLRRVR